MFQECGEPPLLKDVLFQQYEFYKSWFRKSSPHHCLQTFHKKTLQQELHSPENYHGTWK